MRLAGFKKKLDTYNRIEISKEALLHNAGFFRRRSGLEIIPVVKSNAYGHGIEVTARALADGNFPLIAVDGYFEAQKIRKITKIPVLVMGMIKPGDFKKIKIKNIEFVVQDKETIKAIGGLNGKVKVHLDINTGMNRYGIDPSEFEDYLALLAKYPRVELTGIMTHLADPDGKNEDNITQAVKLFDGLVGKALKKGFNPKYIHVGQSASSVRLKSKYANTTRIGLGLYGLNPFSPGHKLYAQFSENLQPALKLISTISKINQLKKGDGVSYNYTFKANKPMKIAVLPLGYYEGIDWRLSNKGKVKLGDDYLPIVGKVCMNHTMVDISSVLAKVGDEVVVYSDNLEDENSLNSVAEQHGLFVYELSAGLSADIRRVLV